MKNTSANRAFILIKIERGDDLGNDPGMKRLFALMKKRGLVDGQVDDTGIANPELTEKGEEAIRKHEQEHPLTWLLENKVALLFASVLLAFVGGFASGIGEALGHFLLGRN